MILSVTGNLPVISEGREVRVDPDWQMLSVNTKDSLANRSRLGLVFFL